MVLGFFRLEDCLHLPKCIVPDIEDAGGISRSVAISSNVNKLYGTGDVVPIMIEKLSFILNNAVAKCEECLNTIFNKPAEVEKQGDRSDMSTTHVQDVRPHTRHHEVQHLKGHNSASGHGAQRLRSLPP
jgi:hypothetical protein